MINQLLVDDALTTLVSLAALLLLQLWIDEGTNHTNPEAFCEALNILTHLGQSSVIQDRDCKPNHAAMGPKPEKTHNLVITRGSSYAIAMVDRKSRAFAEYFHEPSLVHAFKSQIKNHLIQEIIQDSQPFYKFWEELTSNNTKGGWRVETLHLLAQVCRISITLEITLTKNSVR